MAARGTPRTPLSRPVVLTRAVALADADGVEAVSMRRLAEELGVVPMALYKHVADKEDLVDGMVDTVLASLDEAVPAPPQEWRAAVRDRVMAARRSVLAHPWLRRAIETRTVRTPAVLDHMETITSLLLRGGLSADLTHHAMHALGSRIWGFSSEMFDESAPRARGKRSEAAQPDPAGYPGIIAVVTEAERRRPGAGCDEEFEFCFGLDLLLDGIARLQAEQWASPPDLAATPRAARIGAAVHAVVGPAPTESNSSGTHLGQSASATKDPRE